MTPLRILKAKTSYQAGCFLSSSSKMHCSSILLLLEWKIQIRIQIQMETQNTNTDTSVNTNTETCVNTNIDILAGCSRAKLSLAPLAASPENFLASPESFSTSLLSTSTSRPLRSHTSHKTTISFNLTSFSHVWWQSQFWVLTFQLQWQKPFVRCHAAFPLANNGQPRPTICKSDHVTDQWGIVGKKLENYLVIWN